MDCLIFKHYYLIMFPMTAIDTTKSPQIIHCSLSKLSDKIIELNHEGWYVEKGDVNETTNQIALTILFVGKKDT